VVIGERCLIGADVMIVDTDFHPMAPIGRRFCSDWKQIRCQPVLIGDDVFIGARSIILKGVHIGDGSVIGAGSVVAHSIRSRVVAVGNPARVIGEI
jgi:acetyltransferase-like isoleucine patch superfamily enzyme